MFFLLLVVISIRDKRTVDSDAVTVVIRFSAAITASSKEGDGRLRCHSVYVNDGSEPMVQDRWTFMGGLYGYLISITDQEVAEQAVGLTLLNPLPEKLRGEARNGAPGIHDGVGDREYLGIL